ncbi:MAG: DUF3800 domain-containing protein [candidate division Zixibacteria bacterium]
MAETINIYCDESCHLQGDHQKVMILGGVWCPLEKVKYISRQIKEIKKNHGFKSTFEIKWTKVSPAKIDFYLNIVDYFFDDNDLHFRGLIVPDKTRLNHASFNQTHDDWYYKMYFDMLKIILKPNTKYNIYLDIKDSNSASKSEKLQEVLCNNMYDFSRDIIQKIQIVRSHEIELLQLADLFIGAESYINRELKSSEAKLTLIERIKNRSGYSLTRSTLMGEDKFNLFRWQATEV